ncbi:MAG: pectate lyase, partial [Planctomycetota bacterium]
MVISMTSRPRSTLTWILACVLVATLAEPSHALEPGGRKTSDPLQAAKLATQFLTEQVSTQGGYLWKYSADLSLKEGEGIVRTSTAWVQPPGTPTIGESFLNLYEATEDPQFLDAARAVGQALLKGQMRSGGWQAMIEFDDDRRKKWAYVVDLPAKKRKDQSSLDDDKTQSATRFVIRLDRALKMKDEAVHEMAMRALDGLITKGQLRTGGFPQVWTDQRQEPLDQPIRSASYPDDWPREYPGHQQYWHRYTLNDNLAPDVLDTLFLAADVYQNKRYRDAAVRLADSLLLSQMPDPQPAWAQQYSFDMQPIWARKFEPPAITAGESQGVIGALMLVYQRTGDRKYLRPIPKALDYLKRCELPHGQLARFYELKTNRPLYFTRDYQLSYDDADVPTHYAFKVSSKIDRLRSQYEKLAAQKSPKPTAPKQRRPSRAQLRSILMTQDERGAWVVDDRLRYHKVVGPIIDMKQTAENLNALARHLAE